MRKYLALAVASCAFGASAAQASVTIVQNAPMAPYAQNPLMVQDGTFSDSLNSGGTNNYALGLAQGFTTASAFSLDRLTVWGASEYSDVPEPWLETSLSSNITGFQTVLLKQNALGAYQQVHSWVVNRANTTMSATGNYSSETLGPVIQVGMDLVGGPASLAAGTYYLAVGAIMADGDGDSWSWTHGQWDGTNPSNLLIATIGDTPTSWGQWSAVPNGTSTSFHLEGAFIPGPGILAFMAVAPLGSSLGGGRRRRR